MRFNQATLDQIQLTRFTEDFTGNVYLADIMDCTSQRQDRLHFVIQTQLPPDRGGKLGDTALMPCRIGIFGFSRIRQHFDSLPPRLHQRQFMLFDLGDVRRNAQYIPALPIQRTDRSFGT